MSLEEAEPIPEISWSIRVLQPPPEQEHVQYGELGRGRGAPSPSSPAQCLWSPFPSPVSHFGIFEITSKRYFFSSCGRSWGVVSRHLSTYFGYQTWASPGQIVCSGITEPKEDRPV